MEPTNKLATYEYHPSPFDFCTEDQVHHYRRTFFSMRTLIEIGKHFQELTLLLERVSNFSLSELNDNLYCWTTGCVGDYANYAPLNDDLWRSRSVSGRYVGK